MNILILGGGGREHALAWAAMQNPKCDRLIVAPGNAGIAEIAECAALDIEDGARWRSFAVSENIDLVIVGPRRRWPRAWPTRCARRRGRWSSAPRGRGAAGGVQELHQGGLRRGGRAGAAWARFTDVAAARRHLSNVGAPIVVKADGLAAGKGVTVCETVEAAVEALADIFAEPGAAAVLEEKMTGEEASLFALCDGENAVAFGLAQDHKRAFDGDTWPQHRRHGGL
jgi:phosphoribosylamine--glycine ligase